MPHHHRPKRGMAAQEMATNATIGTPTDSSVDIEQPLMDSTGDMAYDLVDCGNGYSAALLYQEPAETLKWLELEGVQRLGTFKVRVSHHTLHPRISTIQKFHQAMGLQQCNLHVPMLLYRSLSHI